MKKTTLLLLFIITIASCKDKAGTNATIEPQSNGHVTKPRYPDNLVKVFGAHGGLDTWKAMRSLEFSIERPDGFEITTTDLKECYALVEMPGRTIGFDGESVWMSSNKNTEFEDDPRFYYNAMFYRYAMPFVLADGGINYEDAKPLTFQDTSYPGIKISFNHEIGNSPMDEYVLYYDKDTFQMVWLGYTATLGQNQKNNDWHFIKYVAWQEVEGLLLPEAINLYNVENNLPTTVKDSLTFSHMSLSTDRMALRMYMMPDGAEVVQ